MTDMHTVYLTFNRGIPSAIGPSKICITLNAEIINPKDLQILIHELTGPIPVPPTMPDPSQKEIWCEQAAIAAGCDCEDLPQMVKNMSGMLAEASRKAIAAAQQQLPGTGGPAKDTTKIRTTKPKTPAE